MIRHGVHPVIVPLLALAQLGCAGDDPEAALASLEQPRGDAGSHSTPPRGTPLPIDTTPPSPELLARLRSEEPLPPPLPVPAALRPAIDLLGDYRDWVRANDAVAFLVRIRELTPARSGTLARVEILQVSRTDAVSRDEFVLPDGVSCEVGEVHVGDVVVLHAFASSLADITRSVRIISTRGTRLITRADEQLDGSFIIHVPWGDSSFDAIVGGA